MNLFASLKFRKFAPLAFAALTLAVGSAHAYKLTLPNPEAEEQVVVPIKPRMLDLKPLAPNRLERLNEAARKHYDEAMKWRDKINYEKTLESMEEAVKAQPDDVYLRFMTVQLAQYMGDTRTGTDSVKYYDVAIENLQAMIESPRLNAREKQRAQGALETLASLRQSIGEREEKRHQTGLEMAKKYLQDSHVDEDKAERDRKKKEEMIKQYVESLNREPYGTEGAMGFSPYPGMGGYGSSAYGRMGGYGSSPYGRGAYGRNAYGSSAYGRMGGASAYRGMRR